jgi:signal peptidase II
MKFILFISFPLYALDQLTKWLVRQFIPPDDGQHPVVHGFFYLVNVTNDGAAFGSFKNNNAFFIVLSCIAFLTVVTLLLSRRSPDFLGNLALALLLGGIMGNLTDRMVHGHVFDFLLFYLHVPLPMANPFPAFNVADSCICVAVVCFVIHSFKKQPTEEKTRRVDGD